MSDEIKKKYDEAARKFEGNTHDEASAGRYHGFLAGAAHADKEGYNRAIDDVKGLGWSKAACHHLEKLKKP